MEISGPGGGKKTDALAILLPDASVRRPERYVEVQLIEFDEPVLPTKLTRTLVSINGCEPDLVRIGEPPLQSARHRGGLGAASSGGSCCLRQGRPTDAGVVGGASGITRPSATPMLPVLGIWTCSVRLPQHRNGEVLYLS